MQNTKEKILKNVYLKQYTDLISKIAKVEYKTMNLQHLIDYEELINIGYQTINILSEEKDFHTYNESYLSTAIKWAIRNELRNRYRWYGVKYGSNKIQLTESEQNELKDAIYKTVLSTDELFDNEKTFEVKDQKATPEEYCERVMLRSAIKEAVATLPKRERELIESKFFKEKKLHEISDDFLISQSRISRIIKSGLDKLKDELIKSEAI